MRNYNVVCDEQLHNTLIHEILQFLLSNKTTKEVWKDVTDGKVKRDIHQF